VGDLIQKVLVFFEILIAGPRGTALGIVDQITPVDRNLRALTGFQRAGQINPHHGFDHGIRQRIVFAITDRSDLHTAVKGLFRQQLLHRLITDFAQVRTGIGQMRVRIKGKNIGIELHPEIAESIGRVIGIGNFLRADDFLKLVIQFDINHIVSLLLPVFFSGCPGSRAKFVRGRQCFFQLSEFIFLLVFLIADGL